MKPEKNKILIIDDDETNRDLLSIILKADDLEVKTAEDGRRALEIIKAEPLDLLLLDLMMPVIDGYQVLRVVRADQALRNLPVIIISAVSKGESVKHCISLGARDYILKPFSQDEVRHRVRLVLAAKNLQDVEKELTRQLQGEKQRAEDLINVIIPDGLSLMKETKYDALVEKIVRDAMQFTNAEAAILYILDGENSLRFEVVRNRSLKVAMGGTTGNPCPYPPLHVMSDSTTGEPNDHFAVTQCVHMKKQININLEQTTGVPGMFTTKFFDEEDIFKATTFLISPLTNPYGQVIGVLELINAQEREKNLVVPFSEHQAQMVQTHCQLATVALELQRLREPAKV